LVTGVVTFEVTCTARVPVPTTVAFKLAAVACVTAVVDPVTASTKIGLPEALAADVALTGTELPPIPSLRRQLVTR